jgi:hypothetical protein
MAHAMMLDKDWEKVARRILQWLGEVLPRDRGAPAAEAAL